MYEKISGGGDCGGGGGNCHNAKYDEINQTGSMYTTEYANVYEQKCCTAKCMKIISIVATMRTYITFM